MPVHSYRLASFVVTPLSAHKNGPGGDNRADGHVGRIIAGFGGVSHARDGLAVDEYRAAAHGDRPFVCRLRLEGPPLWNVRRLVCGGAVDGCRSLAVEKDITAEFPVDLPGKRMGQRRGDRSAGRGDLHDVGVGRHDTVAFFCRRERHPSASWFRGSNRFWHP
ncbi:hypothetical protein DESC_780045 [Desulfosarcina cetonica]|nr:hypothetical protein DESC_780045 [Desulfosarcina cetonica]